MKNREKWRHAFLCAVTLTCFLYIAPLEVHATSFPDVKEGYWAEEEITWASEKGLVTGYKDGRFGPGDEMTEAQFAVMLGRYFGMQGERKENEHWAMNMYRTLARDGNLRLPGLRHDDIKNREVTRGIVSQAFAHTQGQASGLMESIAWMFEEGLTTGRKNGETETERFDVNGKLTRAQAAVFFKRFHDKVGTEWKSEGLLDLTPEGANEYTEKVRALYRERGVTVYARELGFGTADEEFYHLFQAYEGGLREFAVARTTQANFELAAEAAEELGAPIRAKELEEALVAAHETEETIMIKGVEIIPEKRDIFILWNMTNNIGE